MRKFTVHAIDRDRKCRLNAKKNALSSQSLREARDATICLISTSHSNLQTRIAISHPRTLPMPFSNQVCFLLVFAPFVCADQITPRPLSANQVKPSGWMDRCRQGSPLIKRKGPSERKEERTFLFSLDSCHPERCSNEKESHRSLFGREIHVHAKLPSDLNLTTEFFLSSSSPKRDKVAEPNVCENKSGK